MSHFEEDIVKRSFKNAIKYINYTIRKNVGFDNNWFPDKMTSATHPYVSICVLLCLTNLKQI